MSIEEAVGHLALATGLTKAQITAIIALSKEYMSLERDRAAKIVESRIHPVADADEVSPNADRIHALNLIYSQLALAIRRG